MVKRYNIILGIALLVAVGTGYFFNQNRYFHRTTGEEISKSVYQDLEAKKDWRVEWHYNYDAGFTGALTTLGIGLILSGLISRKRQIFAKTGQTQKRFS
ncbi:hypothetical protein ACD591_17450 [Rufibacter glacialis]|uniref:Uncharacterized protein n=1 Tax=Rufibacter glacialis TaxID=1259555 RepID=A0A5M8QGM3_9BACT|nr:hypothetical protein [Rufibacter glacialis]KAA6434368.1 hypothetical protein FOE74_09185 [Rufibacter glacialis]GGK68885.1 hypothetical protein GCM10011405_16300 [Rufibacter glacialis]